MERLRSADAAAEAAAEAAARERGERVLSRVMKDKLTDASRIPLRDWAELDDERRRVIEALLEHNLRGDEPAPDPTLFDALVSQMTQAPRAFAQRDLMPLAARLPQAQWQRLRDWQAGIQRDDPATEDQIYAIRRGLQIGGRMLSDVDPTEAATRRMALIEEIDTWRRINGKSPDDADIAGMLARHVPAEPGATQTLEGDQSDIHLAQARPREPAKARRGIAPQTEPAPGSPEHRNAQAELQELAKRRRGIAPLTEPRPGSPVFREAMAAAKAITDPGPPSEPDPGTLEFRDATAAAQAITDPPPPPEPAPGSPVFQEAVAALKTIPDPGVPVVLPNGKYVPSDEDGGTPYLMSPVADLSEVAAAGRKVKQQIAGRLLFGGRRWSKTEAEEIGRELVREALGQGGRFDYQRAPLPDGAEDYLQLRQFRDVSNFNVGLFMQQIEYFNLKQVLQIGTRPAEATLVDGDRLAIVCG